MGRNEVIAMGNAPVDKVNEVLGSVNIPEGDYVSIAGYIHHRLKRIPKKGEKVRLRNAEIEILEASDKEIVRVRVRAGRSARRRKRVHGRK